MGCLSCAGSQRLTQLTSDWLAGAAVVTNPAHLSMRLVSNYSSGNVWILIDTSAP